MANPSTNPNTTSPTGVVATSTSPGQDQLLELVSFVVGQEEFAIPILSVQEINRMLPVTRVPQSPPAIKGVINLRGKIIAVMDLRKRFGLPQQEATSSSRIIVVEVASRVLGFTVDRVNEVLRVPASIIEPPPAMTCGAESDYIEAVAKLEGRLLILLNLDRLFNHHLIDEASGQHDVKRETKTTAEWSADGSRV